MDIQELLGAILKRIKLIIFITIIGAIAGFCVSKFLISKKYTTSISMYVKNTDNANSTTNMINATDLTASKDLVSTYIVILNNDVVLDEISDMLLNDYRASDLSQVMTVSEKNGKKYISSATMKKLVSMEAENQTEVLKISATTKNAAISADICNYFSAVAPKILKRVTKAGSVETIGTAKIPDSPSAPNVSKNTALCAFLGLLISVFIAIIQYMLDRTIRSSDELKEKFNAPVLGEIPNFFTTTKGGYRKYGYKDYK